jgi:hypothetical protein
MFMKILCLGASTVLFMFMSAGCGSSGNDNKGGGTASVDSESPCKTRSANAQDWSTYLRYDYNQNGCDSGTHEFNSSSAYCSALADDATNNNCAHDARMTDYASQCTGTTGTNGGLTQIPFPY